MDRLNALEPGDNRAIASSCSASTTWTPDLIRCFGVGFACAWIFGGVALLFTLPADATPSLERAPVLLRSGFTSEPSVMEARLWGWKLSLSKDRAEPKLARRD
jgi:hypothetical protein